MASVNILICVIKKELTNKFKYEKVKNKEVQQMKIKKQQQEAVKNISISLEMNNNIYHIVVYNLLQNGTYVESLRLEIGIDKLSALFQLQRFLDLIYIVNRSPYEAAVSLGIRPSLIKVNDGSKEKEAQNE